MGYHYNYETLTKFISRLILSRTNSLSLQLLPSNDVDMICYNVNKNNTNLAILPAPIIKHYYKTYKNIEFVSNIQHEYLFLITTATSNIQNMNQLSDKKIGVPTEYQIIFSDVINTGKITIADKYLLVQKLVNSEIDILFMCGTYPNSFINNMFHTFSSGTFVTIPIVMDKDFYTNNIQYRPYNIKAANNFMIKNVIPDFMTTNLTNNINTYYPSIVYDISLITNKYAEQKTMYDISKLIFEKRKMITDNTNQNMHRYTQDPFTPADIASPSLDILPIHSGAKKLFLEKGMITYCKDPICMTTIGIKRCTACDDNNELETTMQWKQKLLQNKIMSLY